MKCKFPNLGSISLSIVVGGLVLAATLPALADVKLEVTNLTYELKGLTREAIDDDLHRVATKDGDGIIEGEVSDNLTWKLQFEETNGTCSVTSDDVILKLRVTLPVWVDEARAGPQLRAVWSTYYQDLRAHEDGHKAIAMDAAERINKIAHQASAAGACDAFRQSLDSAARQIAEAAEEAQDRHDADAKPFALE